MRMEISVRRSNYLDRLLGALNRRSAMISLLNVIHELIPLLTLTSIVAVFAWVASRQQTIE